MSTLRAKKIIMLITMALLIGAASTAWTGSIFMTGEGLSSIIEMDSEDGEILGEIPIPVPGPLNALRQGLGEGPDGSVYFVAGEVDNVIYQLDAETGAVLNSFPAPSGLGWSRTDGLAYTNGFLYSLDYNAGMVFKIDPNTGQAISSCSFPGLGLLIGGLGGGKGRLFTTVGFTQIYELDFDTCQTVGEPIVFTNMNTGRLNGLCFDGTNLFAGVAAGSGSYIAEIDPDSGETLNSFSVGFYPSALACFGDVTVIPGILSVRNASVVFSKYSNRYGRIQLRADFEEVVPSSNDLISIKFDGIELFSRPLSDFYHRLNSNVFRFVGRDVWVRLNFRTNRLTFTKKNVDLIALDNSDGVDVELHIGNYFASDNILMEARQHGRKLIYRSHDRHW